MKVTALKKYLASGSLLLLMAPSLSYAFDGVVNFSGSITAVTCDINGRSPGDDNVTNVDLGKVTPGALAGLNTASTFVPFKLQLSGAGCAEDSKVSIAFDQVGNVDPVTGNLKLTGTSPATGVQIQVFNDTTGGKKIPLGQAESLPQVATVDENGKATLSYKASYVSTVATGVTAGSGISFVRYSLSYQ